MQNAIIGTVRFHQTLFQPIFIYNTVLLRVLCRFFKQNDHVALEKRLFSGIVCHIQRIWFRSFTGQTFHKYSSLIARRLRK